MVHGLEEQDPSLFVAAHNGPPKGKKSDIPPDSFDVGEENDTLLAGKV